MLLNRVPSPWSTRCQGRLLLSSVFTGLHASLWFHVISSLTFNDPTELMTCLVPPSKHNCMDEMISGNSLKPLNLRHEEFPESPCCQHVSFSLQMQKHTACSHDDSSITGQTVFYRHNPIFNFRKICRWLFFHSMWFSSLSLCRPCPW